jgi:hypothetical protein
MVMPVCPRFLYTASNKVTEACDEPAAKLPIDPPAAERPESLVPHRTVVKVKAPRTPSGQGCRHAGRGRGEARSRGFSWSQQHQLTPEGPP